MIKRSLSVLAAILLLCLALLYVEGRGAFQEPQHAGEASAPAVSPEVTARREQRQSTAAAEIGVARPKQILFGDLHVHTTFSFDAFQMSLPMAGGSGAAPVADACDFARHCSALDFWSINDHAVTLTPRRWRETVESIRQCNAVAGGGDTPDLVSYLGWEWTQVGTTPGDHYGHKNVVLRDLEDGRIPTRPVSAGVPELLDGSVATSPPTLALGVLALLEREGGGAEFARYLYETGGIEDCPSGVPVRELPTDCREIARTPTQLFAKLDDWGHEALVIPHGTTWGFYTPPGSSWDKQLTPAMHDPNRQTLVEVFSGHGNSEEFRPFREAIVDASGERSCPPASDDYLPSCWRAGEIIQARCLAAGESEEECEERAETARYNHVNAIFNGGVATVSGWEVRDWQDAGQCRDCFQPAFNYRPRSSVQYMTALGRKDGSRGDLRFRFGFIASSDNHSARPGTGYKEVARTTFTESRFGNFLGGPIAPTPDPEALAESTPFKMKPGDPPFVGFETERGASFFLNGGLAAVHATGRDRNSIWQGLKRKEVYGTSGPRMLLWFDLLNASASRPVPMGSEVELADNPIFQVRAVGSFEQQPGCPSDASQALGAEALARLCQGECYNPGEERRLISRIEVVRIRPQASAGEAVEALIEDPWKVLECQPDPAGCQVAFSDQEFRQSGRDAVYYVRAIEEPGLAVGADPLGCTRDKAGRCIDTSQCFGRPVSDDCLAETEERAWSSPIFVDQAPS